MSAKREGMLIGRKRYVDDVPSVDVAALTAAYLSPHFQWVRDALLVANCSELVDLDGETVCLAVHLPTHLARRMTSFKEEFKEAVGPMRSKVIDKRHGWQRFGFVHVHTPSSSIPSDNALVRIYHMFVWLAKGGTRPALNAVHRPGSASYNAVFTQLARKVSRSPSKPSPTY